MLMIQPQLPAASDGERKSGKNLVLVLDKSGSMRGDKIDQTRRAARHVVERLRGRDRFTLITYDSKVETFRNELSSADKATRSDALEYVDAEASAKQINEATIIEQFSDRYFDLLKKLNELEALYLAEDSEVLVILNGKSYRITLAEKR